MPGMLLGACTMPCQVIAKFDYLQNSIISNGRFHGPWSTTGNRMGKKRPRLSSEISLYSLTRFPPLVMESPRKWWVTRDGARCLYAI